MVFQKGRPRPPLRVKTCVICRKSYQPMSGAQKTCGEPDCKAKARAQNAANKKAGRDKRLDVKEEVARALSEGRLGEANIFFNGQEVEGDAPPRAPRASRNGNVRRKAEEEPTLELDLSPLENYVKQIVARSQDTSSRASHSDEDLRELIREIVKEEISARLKPLLGG